MAGFLGHLPRSLDIPMTILSPPCHLPPSNLTSSQLDLVEVISTTSSSGSEVVSRKIHPGSNLECLKFHTSLFVIHTSTQGCQAVALKVVDKDGHHAFTCKVHRITRFVGCCGAENPTDTLYSTSLQDHEYWVVDPEGHTIVKGLLKERVMTVTAGGDDESTPCSTIVLGQISRSGCHNTFKITNSPTNNCFMIRGGAGLCLCPCGVKDFKIFDGRQTQVGKLARIFTDTGIGKNFEISFLEELPNESKGIILVFGLMIYDLFFSDTLFDPCVPCTNCGIMGIKYCYMVLISLILLGILMTCTSLFVLQGG